MLGYEAYWHLPKFFNPDNHAREPQEIHKMASLDQEGACYGSIGFAINILCIPESLHLDVDWLPKVESTEEHPLRKGANRFHP